MRKLCNEPGQRSEMSLRVLSAPCSQTNTNTWVVWCMLRGQPSRQVSTAICMAAPTANALLIRKKALDQSNMMQRQSTKKHDPQLCVTANKRQTAKADKHAKIHKTADLVAASLLHNLLLQISSWNIKPSLSGSSEKQAPHCIIWIVIQLLDGLHDMRSCKHELNEHNICRQGMPQSWTLQIRTSA